jgi:hypothetical protein
MKTWQEQGKCWGLETGKGESDIFFIDGNLTEAREYCVECPVKKECIAEGTWGRSTGIWGGTTIGQRRYLRERRLRPDNPISLKVS